MHSKRQLNRWRHWIMRISSILLLRTVQAVEQDISVFLSANYLQSFENQVVIVSLVGTEKEPSNKEYVEDYVSDFGRIIDAQKLARLPRALFSNVKNGEYFVLLQYGTGTPMEGTRLPVGRISVNRATRFLVACPPMAAISIAFKRKPGSRLWREPNVSVDIVGAEKENQWFVTSAVGSFEHGEVKINHVLLPAQQRFRVAVRIVGEKGIASEPIGELETSLSIIEAGHVSLTP